MRKIISLVLVLTMLAALLVGCGAKPAEPAATEAPKAEAPAATEAAKKEEAPAAKKYDGVELTMWCFWSQTEPQGKVIAEAAEAFEAETGAKIKIEWKGRDLKKVIPAALESGEKIDLFNCTHEFIFNQLPQFCLDLTEMANAVDYENHSFKVFNDQVRAATDGKLICMTEQPQVGGIFYNKDLLDKCGLTAPKTWDEMLEVCKVLKENDIAPFALDAAYADFMYSYHLDRYIGQDAITEMSMNGGWSKNEAVAKAADDMIELVKAGYFVDGAPDEFPASENKMGLYGNVAMIVCANYVCSEVNNNTGAKLNWSLMNYPAVEGGADPSNAFAGAGSWSVVNTSEHADACFDFIHMLVVGEWDQKMADTAQQIPADPSNTAPAIMNGTIEVLNAAETPLKWNCGFTDNGDVRTGLKDACVGLFSGKYATGADFAAALDALY